MGDEVFELSNYPAPDGGGRSGGMVQWDAAVRGRMYELLLPQQRGTSYIPTTHTTFTHATLPAHLEVPPALHLVGVCLQDKSCS